MAQMQLVLAPGDVLAALQAWVQTPGNFNPNAQHEMNMTVAPIFHQSGSVTVLCNY